MSGCLKFLFPIHLFLDSEDSRKVTIEGQCLIPLHCSSEWEEYKIPQTQASLLCQKMAKRSLFFFLKEPIIPFIIFVLSESFITVIQNESKIIILQIL